ncbi:hypothetical protein BDZ88DRAFT_47672 [Geranomyces variabilis]|nr:hypothetical protein BDZ88DRAFT_47672 [Geranomyces variabilis]
MSSSARSSAQSRFLACYKTCGNSRSARRYRASKCKRFLLGFPSKMLAAAKGSANFYSADIHDPIGVYTAWSKQQACATGNCLNSQPVFEHLFPFFNASVTVSGNVTIPLFGSRSNKIMLYSDLAGAYALNASGVASVFIDASVNRLTRGTHIAKTIEGLLIYNKQITTVNFVVQQNSTETCSVFQAALERFITQAAAASCGTGRSSITPYSLAAWTTGGTLSACQSAIAKRADRADDTSLGKRVRSAETFITDVSIWAARQLASC